MKKWVASWALVAVAAGVGLSGCAVSESDVHRWEGTEQGPRKLYAVATHAKYAWPLRVEAALSLIKMKPRGGKVWAIPYLVDGYVDENGESREGAIVALSAEDRKKMLESLVPELVNQIKQPLPAKKEDGTTPPDPSVPFKDVAFALLSHDPPLVTDDAVRAQLATALTEWATSNLEARLDYTVQQYGIEQMFRYLGANSVKTLPGLLKEESSKTDRIAGLIADLGDAETKQKASVQLVAIAKQIDSEAWIKKQTPLVEEANKRAKANVSKEAQTEQVKKYQEQELIKVFTAMKKVGGRPVIDYALGFAAKGDNSEERRKAALAALEGRVDKNNAADIEKLFDIAKDDNTPDSVRDLAFTRLGELPKEIAVPKMYALFDASKKWKVRWVAASLVLRTMTTKDLPEFMNRLPKNSGQKMGMTEPISYGGLIAKLDAPAGEKKPREAITPYLKSNELGAKLSAIGYFYGGKKADVSTVTALEGDNQAVPKCEKDDECGWSCDVAKAPGSAEKESKEIHTVGEFVKFCIVPSMEGGGS
ncbi:hypothetical protein LZC95_52325 [Pendulispora brunnea]|uniref:HEAT repeat domain-containing protein n=1 Tax=Pendulispora brunnea TaxID=2905690 RepID=A0ABZ2K8I1_9BACT